MNTETSNTRRTRAGGRAARLALRDSAPEVGRMPVRAGMEGGRYNPLSQDDLLAIHRAALDLLGSVGIGQATPEVIEIATARGCSVNTYGRLVFPPVLIEDLLAGAAREYVIYSRDPAYADLHVGGGRVHYATSGEAVSVLDFEARNYRPSTLQDVYDTARLVDALPNIHQYGQMVVPTEIEDLIEHDINVVYAVLSGTTKPVEHTFNTVASLPAALEIYAMIAGSEKKFRERPFVSFGGCPIVSPLRFAPESLDVLIATSRLGLVSDIAVAPQAGATAPAYLAGTLAQVVAETLACLAVVNMVRPGCPMSFAAWPFAVDLRTGSFSGGAAEVAVSMAAIAQIGRFYDLPTTVAASMSDAKMPDAQMGYEKGIASVVAGLAGANRVLESAGMMASLMGVSYEAMVIDNDMLGMAQRVVRGIEVSDETLSVDTIKAAVLGEGHFLGAADTLKSMQTEFHYPQIADRASVQVWTAEGAQTIGERARNVAADLLANHFPQAMDTAVDAAIRDRFPIRLPRERMRPVD
ncbi:trimethylamine methyltransferase family protein [Ruegeria sp. WL0004]|uniref:Methyltransferase n=1 Tax=Ruegeria marisflavi TaxID=2984152 RepID=A0ABT2WVQ5_9RHOB|nr:trimethylamine methyltransferase family protein [Ruegeria sp. WL0004]MCU9839985.1 trimethylamine methyltransferase family protein [Ruegeria sp. WL0004]